MDIETVVIGAGVVGLAIGKALLKRRSDVLVIERATRPGTGTSARNSEVLHAGLYYPQGSLKARLCVEGRRRLTDYCRDSGVPMLFPGKLVVAADPSEIEHLKAIANRSLDNGVTDIRLLTGAEASRLEPQITCAAALLSPSTGIIDSHALTTALETEIRQRGATLALATTVTAVEPLPGGGFRITAETSGQTSVVTAQNLVLAAGLETSHLARGLAPHLKAPIPETRFAKGHYFDLAGPAPFARLVYPLPGRGGLGIHFTRSLTGAARFGPDIEWCAEPSLNFEDDDGRRRQEFVSAIRRYWPGIEAERLRPGTVGIRPKISAPGEPAADFAIHGPETHGLKGLVALYGIESPGLTASLAIGEYAARLIEEPGRA